VQKEENWGFRRSGRLSTKGFRDKWTESCWRQCLQVTPNEPLSGNGQGLAEKFADDTKRER
jgi:hypothetical protein